jgi:hypothetical protein
LLLFKLPLACLLLLLKVLVISSWGMALGKVQQDPNTVAAQTDLSERECLILETVSPPQEKARSTSVDVAEQILFSRGNDVQ